MHDIGLDQVLDAIGELYSAAYGEISWTTAIETLRRLFRGSSANFVRHGAHLGDGDLITTEMAPAFQESFIAEYASAANPFIHAAMTAQAGMYGGLFCKIWESDTSVWAFNVQRGRHQEEFGQGEIDMLQRLLPHLRRAAAIAHGRQMTQALVSAYAQLPFGVLLLDPDQRIIQANDHARRLLAQPGSCLQVEAERLICASPYAPALRRLIDSARQSPAPPSACLLLRQPAVNEATQELMISVLPAAGGAAHGVAWEPCVAVLLREINPHPSESFDAHLRTTFSLTPAEARLAATLCAGQSLKAAAARQDIRFSTARHYLERIFQKTGTSQQSQLVLLLMSLQPLL